MTAVIKSDGFSVGRVMAVHCPQSVFVLVLVLLPVLQPAYSSGGPATYPTEFAGNRPDTVYKSLDSRGVVSYSARWPQDTIEVKAIEISPGPPEGYQRESRQRYEKIREMALELTEAREKRQAEREEAEKKRLEKLALQRAAQPLVYETRVYVGWHPLWWPAHRTRHYDRFSSKKPAYPVKRPGLSRSAPLHRGTAFK